MCIPAAALPAGGGPRSGGITTRGLYYDEKGFFLNRPDRLRALTLGLSYFSH